MLSHTGLQSVCPSQRNLPDEDLKRIAANGGLIGIALFEPAQCGGDIILSFVRSAVHAAAICGNTDSIALGSDWDGAVHTPVSAAETSILATALLREGNFSEDDVRKIMFENAHRFFREVLPR